ncbi:hypothetical protein [Pandoraea eparura]|nr:hypothetical protein [Pandoraea eparura]
MASTLFAGGVLAGICGYATFAGALSGAGATLLGAGITEFNVRRSKQEEKLRKQLEARRYFSSELKRVVERTLFIHERACANFGCASMDDGTMPGDLQKDFLPTHPTLYPNVQAFNDLPPEDASSLIEFYDSLNRLERGVNDWWAREGQLPVNIFNAILHDAKKSVELALACLERFEIDEKFPPQYASQGTLASRLQRTLDMDARNRAAHLKRFEERQAKQAEERAKKPGGPGKR